MVWKSNPLWESPSVERVLRRQGHVIAGQGDVRQTLLPIHRVPALCREDVDRFRHYFGKASFRKVVRQLLAAQGQAVELEKLQRFAHATTEEYLSSLQSLGLVELLPGGVRLTLPRDNIGPTLEWYVADLCARDLAGSSLWGVALEELPTGGDFDVLAWLDPVLLYVECKSAAPSQISESELRNFLQRAQELNPEMAVLLVDSDSSMEPVLGRLYEIMLPLIRQSSGIVDQTWAPERRFVDAQGGFPGVHFGFRKFYVTNSDPSIVTQLRRCLRHYHRLIKGRSYLGGARINFVTGEISSKSD